MSTVRLVALAAALPSAAFGIFNGIPGLAYLAAGSLAWILTISKLTHMSYNLKVFNFLAMLFVVAIGAMVMIGPLGICYLMATPLMAVILLGLRPAILTLFIGAACMFSFETTGYANLPVADFVHSSLSAAGLFSLTFVCVGLFISLSCNTLIKGLSSSLDDTRIFADSLKDRQQALYTLNDDLRLTSAALAGLNEMVLIAKVADGHGAPQPIIFANSTFERCSGYSVDEIKGRSMRMLYGPDTDPEMIHRIVDAIARRESISGEVVIYSKSGKPCWIEMDIVPFSSEGRGITHWVAAGRDITERRRSADAIYRLAFFDGLTGLPNRRLLLERLNILVNKAHAKGELGALLYIDLDNFKYVNDARGHSTGDALLNHIATCLTQAVHTHDTVARLGGDEFVVLLEGLGRDENSAIEVARSTAERIRVAITAAINIDGQIYQSSGSIGISLPTRPRHTVHDLLREADTAMYYAKSAGRNGVAMFEPIMLAEAENNLTLERDLLNALKKDELALHFQLQVNHAGSTTGVEVLLRWRRADGSIVGPDTFIPVAEATGMIVMLGTWVLRQACIAWHELDRSGHTMPISVNVSPRQFRQPSFVSDVKAIVNASQVPPEQLIFEVTEGLLVDNLDETVCRMHELAKFGVRFSIDDFGTGYSNLAYLRQMPLYELKIDKSFIRDMSQDSNSTAIVQSILAMAGHLNLHVVAEGVETAAQADFLRRNGAPCMQGFLFCRPLPISDLIRHLDDGQARKTPTAIGSEI